MDYKNLAEEANALAMKHNSENSQIELQLLLQKILTLPDPGIKRNKYLNVHPLEDKRHIDVNDIYNMVFDLKTQHIHYLVTEGFSVRYDPTDRCYSVTW